MDSHGVWRGNIGMGRKKGNRGNSREIYKMDTRSGLENARIHDKGGGKKGRNENEGRQESMEI